MGCFYSFRGSCTLRKKFDVDGNAFVAQLAYLPQTLRLIWTASKNWTTAWAILLVVQGILPAATVYLTRSLVNGIAAVVGQGIDWDTITVVAIPGLLMALVMVLSQCVQSLIGYVRAAQSEFVEDHIADLVQQKAVEVDLSFYETPAFFDQLDRAKREARSRSLALLESLGGIAQGTITFIAMVAILIPYGIWLPIVLVISTLPAFYVVLIHNRRYHKWWAQVTPERRWVEYYNYVLTHSAYAPEVRLFGLGSHFRNAYHTLRHRLRGERLQLLKKQNVAQAGGNLFALLAVGVAILWVGRRMLLGYLTLGDLALFYQAFNKGQGLASSLLGNLSQLYTNILFLENLFAYLSLEPTITDPPTPQSPPVQLTESIRFRNVTFRYPGSEQPVIGAFNLEIPAGSCIAIVGANGAGKSTLFKLLCRLYDPEEGAVEFDGIDIRKMPVEALRRKITVLFQQSMPYHATFRENITLSDVSAAPDLDRIETAVRAAGADSVVARLPRSYESLLGKWFVDGAELSGGEWQRVALARAFYRKAEILLLDEPTSAMDSWAEIDWMKRFRTLAQGRTALIITHRFTTAMRADIIHVMDRGDIVETGTHEELLARGGLYAESWTAQMETNRVPDDPNKHGVQASDFIPPLPVLSEITNHLVEEEHSTQGS